MSSATCSKLPPRENSAPAVFSIKMWKSLMCGSSPSSDALMDSAARRSPSSRVRPHQVFRAQRKGALHLAMEGGNGLGANFLGLAAQVDEVASMDHERPAIVFLA